jgi:hypothetical protein
MYKINCESLQDLIDVCAGLVKAGIHFEADTEHLIIKATGGY